MSTGNATSTQPRLVRFYDPVTNATDSRGRTLSSILAWDDSKLEYSHDYIQIVFPLPEGSPVNPSAPIIDRATFTAFQSRPDLRERLKASFARILSFYGFEMKSTEEGLAVIPAPNFPQASQNWVTRFDHNHLRITRIIRSLRVLSMENEAEAFFAALEGVYKARRGQISQKSMMFWTRAAKRPLYLAPEDEEDEGEGQDFLYEYEEARDSENKAVGEASDGAGISKHLNGTESTGEGQSGNVNAVNADKDPDLQKIGNAEQKGRM
ncbi:hypothetical protein MMC24_000594 [Lignoscripta atroalba]|nr:hypothetical protein [Lignoscripta atroalba]